MGIRVIRTFGTLLSVFLFSTAALASVQIGAVAPDFTATDALSGKPVTLSKLRGKPVVLEWNNPNCPFVKKFYSVGAMQQLQENATKKGVIWISVNSSAEGKDGFLRTDKEAKEFVGNRNAHPTYYLRDPSGAIGKSYGAKTTPHMFVIDKDGNLAYMGAPDDTPTADPADIATAKNYVTRALKALTAGTTVAVTTTQPYGCFIKY
jgi:peroxiredoxin